MLLAIERGDGVLRFIVAGHLDKSEPFASPGFAIADHFRALDGAELGEKLLERRAIDAVTEVPDIQTLTHDPISIG
jgi:hypothetical protein